MLVPVFLNGCILVVNTTRDVIAFRQCGDWCEYGCVHIRYACKELCMFVSIFSYVSFWAHFLDMNLPVHYTLTS